MRNPLKVFDEWLNKEEDFVPDHRHGLGPTMPLYKFVLMFVVYAGIPGVTIGTLLAWLIMWLSK